MLRLALVLTSICISCWSQVSIEPRPRKPQTPLDVPSSLLRVDSSTVVIPVHASTKLGGAVVDLKRENFKLFDNDLEQIINYFAQDDAPVSIGILFDSSGSMQKKMKKAREAVASFIKIANREDEFFLVEFNERPRIAMGFTDDTDDLYRRVGSFRPFGRTSLYDAVAVALKQMKSARYSRKALVVFSDGGDNRSRHTFRSIKGELLESDVQLYAIGIYPSEYDEPARSPEEIRGPDLLKELAEASGGRHFAIENLSELPAISERVGLELRTQYILGYSPSQFERDGRFHRVKVRIENDEPLSVQYRHGYYAPFE